MRWIISLLAFIFMVEPLFSQIPCGKIDLAPAYVHIDVLESGKTIHRMNMAALKGDISYLPFAGYGIVIKPTFLCATGDGKLASGGVGLGHCTPITDCLTLTPHAGVLWTYIQTHIDIHTPFFTIPHVRETFRSTSGYLALEITYKIAQGWRISGMFQYVWSRTYTKIKDLVPLQKDHAMGPNYALMLEYDITDKWSVNIGGAYNISLSKEKHGLRGAGVKVGVAYWL